MTKGLAAANSAAVDAAEVDAAEVDAAEVDAAEVDAVDTATAGGCGCELMVFGGRVGERNRGCRGTACHDY